MKPRAIRIINTALWHGQYGMAALRGKSRYSPLAKTRHALWWCLRRHASSGVVEIGEFFNKDHSTVVTLSNKVGKLIDTPECPRVVQDLVDAVRKELANGPVA